MKRFLAVVLLAAAFTVGIMLTTSCSKSGDSGGGGGSSLTIPNMTASVSGSSAVVISEATRSFASTSMNQQNTGMLFTGTAPTGVVGTVFNMVNSFVTNAKTADSFACMIEVLANNGVLKTDGSEAVFMDDQSNEFKAKFVVNASGSTLTNFKLYTCSASGISNETFVEGTRSGDNLTFTMKYDLSGTLKGSMVVDGTWNGTAWSAKSLTMETFLGSGMSLVSKFQVTQNTDNILFKGTYNTGTANTTYQIYSKFGLLGNSPATYAMGAGSMKYTVGSTIDALGHWDLAGATAGTSSFASDVTAGTYFPANVAFTGAMTTGQTWDCQTGSASEIKVSSMTSAVSTGIQSCMENQQ